MKPGDVVYIKATYLPRYQDGNMIRVITADTGIVLWASREEIRTAEDVLFTSKNFISIDRGTNKT